MNKPTLIKITQLGNKYNYPKYEILEDNSGKAYGVDPDEPTDTTEEEEWDGCCYRNGVEYLFIEHDWMRHIGTAAEYEGWNQSTCDELDVMADQLHVGQIFEVETLYLSEGIYNNTVKEKAEHD